jgi:hypothetical protein
VPRESATSSADQFILNYAPRSIAKQGSVIEPLRAGKYLVVGAEARLPARCVRCNEPVVGEPEAIRLYPSTSFTWGDRLVLTLENPPIIVHASYCPRHRRRRRRALRAFTAFVLASIVTAFGALACKVDDWDSGLGVCAVATLALLLGAGTAKVIAYRALRLHHLDRGYAYLKGVCPAFLAALPTVKAPAQ